MLTVNGISKESSNLTINGMNPEGISLNGGDIRLDVTGASFYTLWSWGYNTHGNLGLEDIAHRSSPVQVGALTTWDKIASGYNQTIATKTDGTLWLWGLNNLGQLGLEDLIKRSSPVQVGALTTWDKIADGRFYTLATKTDGILWSWGDNTYGQLGLEDVAHRSSPVQVGSLTTWDKIASGSHHTVATKTDGTLWSWGYNLNGELGLEDIAHRSSPVQVGALTTWDKISAGYSYTLATKMDGTLWSWGRNHLGQLGLEDLTSRSSPVQVGALTTWDKISAGYTHTVAIKTDGTLWSWGRNNYGQLGLGDGGDLTNRSSPVQVGALATWDKIAGGQYHTVATKTDGILWSWGDNTYGQLGLEDVAHRSSPVQVGSLTTWDKIAGGQYHTVAIKTEESTYPLACFDAGNARFRCEGADLSPFARVDNDYILTVKDSANKTATGLIDLPDTALAFGSELITSGGFDAGAGDPVIPADWENYNQDIGEASAMDTDDKHSGVASYDMNVDLALEGIRNRNIEITDKKLYKFSIWLKRTSGSIKIRIWSSIGSGGVTFNEIISSGYASWMEKAVYFIGTETDTDGTIVIESTSAVRWRIDDVSIKEVTHVGADGVTIVDAKNSPTQSWTDIEDGFDYNDSSGYTFEITSVASDLVVNGGD